MKLIFLLEEQSMKYLLDALLPQILPDGVAFQTVPHRGKSDLRRSIPHKLKAWNEPGDIRFVIVHDQDTTDCIELKKELLQLTKGSARPVLIRIACQELEAWYFGDLQAVAQAYQIPRIAALAGKRKYRTPDAIHAPKEELRKLIPGHQQIDGARRIAPYMDIQHNTSASFQTFVRGVRHLAVQ